MGVARELIALSRRVLPVPVKRFLRPLLPNRIVERRGIEEANLYVATDGVSGQLQFELLKREGCRPESKVLEIGCGNLHGAVPMIRYLNEGNYVGIDPNEWLRHAAMENREIGKLIRLKKARFLTKDDFDASELGLKFDFAFAHSILSHCAHWQLSLFLQNVAKVLAPGGRIVVSIRLAEGNEFGSTGTHDKNDSRDAAWQYPGVSWFKMSTVRDVAARESLIVNSVPKYTEFYTKTRPPRVSRLACVFPELVTTPLLETN